MTVNSFVDNDWERARQGKFTSSRISDLMTPPKTKEAKERGDIGDKAYTYIYEKAAEIITGTTRQVQNWSMEWGTKWEPTAAEEVKKKYHDLVYYGKNNPMFFSFTEFSGGSPDFTVPSKYIVGEIKCPENPSNHVEYCMYESAADLKKEYYYQLQMNMACMAIEWGIPFEQTRGLFVSYSPMVNDGYMILKELEILPDMTFYDRLVRVVEKGSIILGGILKSLETTTQGSLIVSGDTINNQSVLIVDKN